MLSGDNYNKLLLYVNYVNAFSSVLKFYENIQNKSKKTIESFSQYVKFSNLIVLSFVKE